MIYLNKILYKILTLLPKSIVRLFSKRYIAGFDFDETIAICKNLNNQGFLLTLDILGEHTKTREEADLITNKYKDILKIIDTNNIKSNISIKPTHIGYDVNQEIFEKNLSELVLVANKYSNFIRIDMENSKITDGTLKAYNKIHKTSNNTGIVLQAYLFRTLEDLKNLQKNNLNFRLCKGIYKESNDIAFQDKNEINENYLKILEYALSNQIYVGIATHDEYLLSESYKLIEKLSASPDFFEFQALYGVPLAKWYKRHIKNNYKVRLYLPFGDDWYLYSLRRIKENPNIGQYVIKNLFKN